MNPNLTTEVLTPELFRQHEKHVAGACALDQQINFFTKTGKSYAFFADGKCFGFFGIFPLWKGVGEGWILLNRSSFRYPLFIRKFTSKAICVLWQEMDLHRLQVDVDASEKHHIRWLQSIGFKFEGTMKKYTFEGENRDRYSLVRE